MILGNASNLEDYVLLSIVYINDFSILLKNVRQYITLIDLRNNTLTGVLCIRYLLYTVFLTASL